MLRSLQLHESSYRLLIGISLLFISILIYNFGVLLVKESAYFFGPLFLICLVLSIYIQRNLYSCLFLFLGFIICMPTITHPIEILPFQILDNSRDFFMHSDRVSLRSIGVLFFSIFLAFLTASFLIREKKLSIVFFLLSILTILTISFIKSYENLSIYQSFLDFGELLGCITIFFIFLNFLNDDNKIENIDEYINCIFYFLSTVILIDLILTFSGLFSWSTSYRNSIQGVFYGHEVTYSFFLGLSFIFILSKLKGIPLFLSSVIFSLIIFLTAVKTTLLAFIAALIAQDLFKRKVINKSLLPLILILFTVTTLTLLNLVASGETSSILGRLITYYVFLHILFSENMIWLGIIPGVIDSSMPSNLSIAVFEIGYVDSIIDLPIVVIEEFLLRSEYEEGGGFLPHNSILALVSSYGIFVLFPMLFYFLIFPIRIIRTYKFIDYKEQSFIASIIIFFSLSAMLHPIMFLSIIVFLTEIIKMKLRTILKSEK